MAALLVALAVMAIAMTVAMPTWRHMVQREKEEELIFRGQQYARAVGLFQRKFAGAYAPDVNTLVKQKCLRKKYTDPMVADGEFELLRVGQQGRMAGTGGGGAAGQRGGEATPGGQGQSTPGIQGGLASPGGQPPGQSPDATSGAAFQMGQRAGAASTGRGGIIGVRSRSTEASIRIYKGGTHYNEWQFVWSAQQARPGGAGTRRPGVSMPAGPGTEGPRGGPTFQPQNPTGPVR